MSEAPEPKDKLDATTTVGANGPEDDAVDWRQVDRRQVEACVRRLRQRIFTASQAGGPTAATAAARHFRPPTSLRGLLEPDARKRARPGSEEGETQQCVPPIRPTGL